MQFFNFLSVLEEFNSILGDPSDLGTFFSEGMKAIATITFLFAALQCFLGYKLFKFWVAVCGFFTFGILGMTIGMTISQDSGMAVFLGILSAILGAFIAFKLYKVGIFILCGFMGFLLGYMLTQSVALGIIMALVLGVLSILFVKPVIIISTSTSSGLLVGTSLGTILDINSYSTDIFLGILFAIFGMLVQFATNKKTTTTNQNVSQDNMEQPITNSQSETVNDFKNTQPKIDGAINNFSKKTSEMVTAIKDSSKKTSDNFWTNIKNKIDVDNSIVIKKSKGITLDDLSGDLEEIFYSCNLLKYIMPFIEYILYFVSFIAIISPFFILTDLIWVGINITLLLFVGTLCFAKRKYIAIAICFSIVTISRSILIIKLIIFQYSTYALVAIFIDTAIVAYISIILIKYFLKSENGISLKNSLVELFNKQRLIQKKQRTILHSENEIKLTISCANCSELNNSADNFCANCGERLVEKKQ